MRLSEDELRHVEEFRAQAEKLKKQGNRAGFQMVNMHALQVVNRAVVKMIRAGNIHDDADGKHEEFIYTDISKELLTIKPESMKQFDLTLYLVAGTPLCDDILQVLEKHLEGK